MGPRIICIMDKADSWISSVPVRRDMQQFSPINGRHMTVICSVCFMFFLHVFLFGR